MIKIQGVWPAVRPNSEKYYNLLAPLVDLIAYNPLIDYLRNDENITYEENFACPQIYQRCVVGYDGMVMPCANDSFCEEIIGDANVQTIHEIWHGHELSRIRSIHDSNDGFLKMKICRACCYPRKSILDERAYVNGREICINNYVDRKQNIGE